MDDSKNTELRRIPSVDFLLQNETIHQLTEVYSKNLVTKKIREVLNEIRDKILGNISVDIDTDQIIKLVSLKMKECYSPSLKKVINATGVILHTNLGRAPLCQTVNKSLEAVSEYCNLEYDLTTGDRGLRYSNLISLFQQISGAEDVLVVNNNAAAVLLTLSALAGNKEVIVSRGQLVEIGGSFRIPEVMEQSGAVLKEVGTTNKTYITDYHKAINENTALLLHVHTSNYKLVGFTHETTVAELVELGKENNLPVIADLGSGSFIDLTQFGLPYEPTVQEIVQKGADLVTFSGDKLLGGPQAGIILGKKVYIDILKKHPLMRAIRVDKITLAVLEETLKVYLDFENSLSRIPVLKMLSMSIGEIEKSAGMLLNRLEKIKEIKAEMQNGYSQVGGGAMPTAELPTILISVKPRNTTAGNLAKNLRELETPIITRIQNNMLLIDPRTLLTADYDYIVEGLKRCL